MNPTARTARELQRQTMVMALIAWAGLAINWSTPGIVDRFSGHVKGTDFVQFFTLATAVNRGELSALVSYRSLRQRQTEALPESAPDLYPPVYPPQVGLALAPLGRLPYLAALAVWVTLTGLLYGACVWALSSFCPRLRLFPRSLGWAAAAFPPLWFLVAHGQLSAVGLVALTAAVVALAGRRAWLAGCAVGLLAYKWSLFLPAFAVCLLAGEWMVVLGAAAAGAAQLALAVPFVGSLAIVQHLRNTVILAGAPDAVAVKPYMMHSLRTFWGALAPAPTSTALYVLSSAIVLAIVVRGWRRTDSPLARISLMACGIVLTSPHLYVYDLLLLVPALMYAADRTLALSPTDAGRVLLVRLNYVVFMGAFIGLAAAVTRLQLATPLLVLWTVLLHNCRQRVVDPDAVAPGGGA